MVEIRKGRLDDLPQVHALIVELAEYERAPQEVTNTLADMELDGFGENPIYKFFVAESEEEIVGIALYFTAYSTWKGRTLYLEDLVVTERLRRAGIGKMLFNAVAREAKETGAKRFAWQVLEWNEPAIAFYKKIGATLETDWYNCRMTEEQIQQYSA
ncbi:GNAT family N-acetyltransferase [Pontibacter sp. 172403-2]|uniref:GNAT family N-acetyltransferase n=1 Tax=Pontibacter rufus TaxID=2791028 RepID=UPI0018AFC676|nr:GNAT family N-acetyltransferase [Pontibacter sp. 172403-2]MBF9252943.1 GNAT family N-acetyltransferase [Pontibacter sp. 172403-2]